MIARRRLGLGAALVATIAASIWAGTLPEPGESVDSMQAHRSAQPVRVADSRAHGGPRADAVPASGGSTSTSADRSSTAAAAAARSDAPATPAAPLSLPQRGTGQAPPEDLFAAYSWAPPPSAEPVRRGPPPPPPIPFVYSGRMESEGQTTFLLAEGARTHIVAIGDVLNGFRLDAASESELAFTHVASGSQIPLRTRP